MSRPFKKIVCLLAGFAVATLAAGSAIAAKPITGSKPNAVKQSLSIKQKNDLAKFMAGPNATKSNPGRRAKEGIMVDAGGAESSMVPEELDQYLGATADAKGRMRVSDIDLKAKPAAAVEATNEK